MKKLFAKAIATGTLAATALTGCVQPDTPEPTFSENKTYTINQGEGLWAFLNNTNQYDDMNQWDVIRHVREYNDIKPGEHVHPGQVVYLPIYEDN